MHNSIERSPSTAGDQQPSDEPHLGAGDGGEQQPDETPAGDDNESLYAGQQQHSGRRGSSLLRYVTEICEEIERERQVMAQQLAQWRAGWEKMVAGSPEELRRSWEDHKVKWEADPQGEWEKTLRMVREDKAKKEAMAAAAAAEEGQGLTVPLEKVNARL